MTDELKPCPFCGESASLGWFASECCIGCDVCQYSMSTSKEDIGQESDDPIDEDGVLIHAISRWNTRAKPRVKPLVFDDLGEADAGCGTYYDLEQPRMYERWCVHFGTADEMHNIGTAKDRDAAIAIANAHHEAHVLSQLVEGM